MEMNRVARRISTELTKHTEVNRILSERDQLPSSVTSPGKLDGPTACRVMKRYPRSSRSARTSADSDQPTQIPSSVIFSLIYVRSVESRILLSRRRPDRDAIVAAPQRCDSAREGCDA